MTPDPETQNNPPAGCAPVSIYTARLELRPLSISDAEDLHLILGDPLVTKYLDLPTSESLNQTRQFLAQWLYVLPEWHATWSIVHLQSRRVIGIVNYHHREIWNERLEIGYFLAQACWGRGFATEAVEALISHCFRSLGVHRIEATIEPENIAAQKLAHRLGFIKESQTLRHRRKVGGTYRDEIMFGLLSQAGNPEKSEQPATGNATEGGICRV